MFTWSFRPHEVPRCFDNAVLVWGLSHDAKRNFRMSFVPVANVGQGYREGYMTLKSCYGPYSYWRYGTLRVQVPTQ